MVTSHIEYFFREVHTFHPPLFIGGTLNIIIIRLKIEPKRRLTPTERERKRERRKERFNWDLYSFHLDSLPVSNTITHTHNHWRNCEQSADFRASSSDSGFFQGYIYIYRRYSLDILFITHSFQKSCNCLPQCSASTGEAACKHEKKNHLLESSVYLPNYPQ